MWSNDVKITKLSLSMVGYLLVSFGIAAIFYWILQLGMFSVLKKIIVFSPIYEVTIEEIVDDLQTFIYEHELTSEDEVEIAYWNMEYYHYWLTLYDDQHVYYSTQNLWYDLGEIEKIGQPDYETIAFSDKSVQLMIYPLISPLFVQMLKTIDFVSSASIFLFIFLLFLSRKLSYILTISNGIERMKHGDLMHKIELMGCDELTMLAQTINEMSDTLALQFKRENEYQSQQMKMIASLSHDLKTPLTMVMSYLELIKEGRYEDEVKRLEYEHFVYQKATQMKELIEQLFNEVKPTEKERMNDSITEEADYILKQATHDFMLSLSEEGLMTDLDLIINSSFSMRIELHDFYRLIDNVYSNLLKYADVNTPVKITVKECETEVVMEIMNQVKQGSEREESYGIGLQSCKEVMSRSGGRLEVQKTTNFFTIRFYFQIIKKS